MHPILKGTGIHYLGRPSWMDSLCDLTSGEFLLGKSYLVALLLAVLVVASYRINGKSRTRTPRPPRVSYLLPWVGSGIAMGKDPDGFLERASSQLGPVFKVKAMGKDLTYITSADLISAIYRDSKNFEFTPIRLEMSHTVFGMSRAAIYSSFMTDEYFPIHHRSFSQKSVASLLQRYTGYASTHILEAVEKLDGTCAQLVPFLILPAYSSAALALFGNAFDAAKSYPSFRRFDDYFHLMAAGVPRFMMPGPHRAWDQVIAMFEKYLQDPHEDSCEFIQTIEPEAKKGGWTDRDIASVYALELWALEANAIWAAYWIIALELQKPQGLSPLTAEIDRSRMDWITMHPGEMLHANLHQWLSSASLPLLTSTIQEVLRVATSTLSIRLVKEPVDFAGYHFEAGERIICATRAVHLDEEIHPRAHEFVSERYMESQKKFQKNGKAVPNHSMPFGGGVSMCEGRHFALGELKIYVSLILSYANMELDPESTARPTFYTSRMGVGLMPAVGDLNVRISKRHVI